MLLAIFHLVTETLWKSGKLNLLIAGGHDWNLFPLAFTAFAPNEGPGGWYSQAASSYSGPDGVDRFSNWPISLPPSYYDLTRFNTSIEIIEMGYVVRNATITTQQLWIQTTNQGIVCLLGNASYDVAFEYVNGARSVSRKTVEFTPLWMPVVGGWDAVNYSTSPPISTSIYSYVAVFTALTSILSGNVTLSVNVINGTRGTALQWGMGLEEETCKVLRTALSACPDMVPSYWFNDTIFEPISGATQNYTPPVEFNKPAWLCRNQTLAPAIEDLFNNITISMLAANIS
jgi:hypothetical protein